MRVSVRTLYGLRALAKLASHSEQTLTSNELANQKYIDGDYLTQILNNLKNDGIIESKKGPSGGYRLSRSPEKITLGEIFHSLEGPTMISPCTEPEHSDCNIIQECSIQNILAIVADKFDEFLKRVTLEDITNQAEYSDFN